jgi:peptidoglycan/LPS O-acetylase OafA/YrhL
MPTSSWGLFGVLLFFVHTCLVLMYSMERSHLTGMPLLKNFVIRRVFRIYPLSILAVLTALTFHLDSDINGIHGLSHGQIPGAIVAASNLLLIQNLTYAKSIVNVLWSLPFELQMYAFLPFLFLWIRSRSLRGRKAAWMLFALWIASVGLAVVQPHIPHLGRLSILTFLPNFVPGVLAYSLPHKPRIASALWPVFIFALVIAFAARPVLSTGWILCFLLGWMIPSFQEIRAPGLRWISNRIATYSYSYGIYLSHQFALWTAFGVLARYPLALRISVLLLMLIALPVALHHAIAKPMIALGVRLANSISDQRLAAEPPQNTRKPSPLKESA